jgi:hypothetical protein
LVLGWYIVGIRLVSLRHGIGRGYYGIYDYFKRGILPLSYTVDRLMPQFQNKYLLLGFDRNSNLLEIMYNIKMGAFSRQK